MSENWKIQVSPKLADGTLINLRAETPDEAVRVLDWAIANAAKISEAVQAVNAVSNVGTALGGQVQSVQQQPQQGGWNAGAATPPPQFAQQTQQQYAQAATQPQGGDEGLIPPQLCAHGQMKLNRAKPGSGKNWVAYMCPTPKGTPGQCSPIDAKTGKSWG